MTPPCKFHEYLNGSLKCFFCGSLKPMLPGCWPENTWLRNRMRYLREQELKTVMAQVQEAKARNAIQ